MDNGVWVACPDETVRALLARRPPIFLYFERREYDGAVSELAPTRVQEVIRRRRDRWAPQAKGYVMGWLLDLERVSLEGILRVAEQRSNPSVAAKVENSLTLLQRLYGLDRYQAVPAKAVAITVLEGESQLLAMLQSAQDSGIFGAAANDQSRLAMHQYQRRHWVQSVCRVAAALGAPEFANSPPYTDVARGVFVHPTTQAFERSLAATGEPAVHWLDGLVFALAGRRSEDQRAQGRSVDLLYADVSEFYRSLDALTQAQLQRDFAARLGRSEADTRRDLLGPIDRLHLYQILLKRMLRARPDAAAACESAGVDTVLREETQLLARSLANTRTFSRSQGLDSVEPPLSLFSTAEDIEGRDLSLFSAIASRYWSSIAQDLREVEALKTTGKDPAQEGSTRQ